MPGPLGITVGICPFNDVATIEGRVVSLLLPALKEIGEAAEILCLDNSRVPSPSLQRLLSRSGLAHRYVWTGQNLRYAATVNRMAELAAHATLVYLCPSHCEARDPSWLRDLKDVLWETSNCALAGSLQPGPAGMPYVHVQGGVFAARTEVLRSEPFDSRFPHDFSDVWMSQRLRELGYQLGSVPSVLSVHGRHPLARGPLPEGVKLRHVGRVRSLRNQWIHRLRLALRPPKQAIASFPKTH